MRRKERERESKARYKQIDELIEDTERITRATHWGENLYLKNLTSNDKNKIFLDEEERRTLQKYGSSHLKKYGSSHLKQLPFRTKRIKNNNEEEEDLLTKEERELIEWTKDVISDCVDLHQFLKFSILLSIIHLSFSLISDLPSFPVISNDTISHGNWKNRMVKPFRPSQK